MQDKRILELGSGAGMLGVTLLKSLQLKDYTFTDCHFKVLNFLIYNLQLNFPVQSCSESYEDRQEQTKIGPPMLIKEENVRITEYHQRINDGEIKVKHLDWTDFEPEKFGSVDVILGSDIVYERSLIGPLCNVIQKVLRQSKSEKPLGYIACTERSHTTLNCFHEQLEKHGLVHEIVHKGSYSPTETILSSDVLHQPTRLYQIELENERTKNKS